MITRFFALVALFVHIGAPALAQQQTVDLSKRPLPGTVAKYTWFSRAWQKAEGSDAKRRTERSGDTEIYLTVTALATSASDESRYRLNFDRLKMLVQTPDGPIEFDSAIKPNVASSQPVLSLDAAVRPLVNVPIEITLDASGTVVSATGAEALLAGDAPHVMIASQFLNTVSVNSKFGSVFSCLGCRATAAAVGEVLKKQEKIAPFSGCPPLTLSREIRLKEVEAGSRVKFELAGTGRIENDPAFQKAGMRIEKASARLDGMGTWDSQKGMAQFYYEVQDLDVRLKFGDSPMSLTARSNIVIKRVD